MSSSRKSARKSLLKKNTGDRVLLSVISILLVFGVIMVYDATVFYSKSTFGEAYRFVLLQLIWIIIGLVGFYYFYNFDYKNLTIWSYILLGGSLPILAFLSLKGLLTKVGLLQCSANAAFAPCVNGAYRWFYFNTPPMPEIPLLGVVGFQPVELAKLGLILYLSIKLSGPIKKDISPFVIFLVPTMIVSLLVFLEPNMSNAVLVILIACLIYFNSNAPLKPFFLSMPMIGVLGTLFAVSSEYRRNRILALLGWGGDNQEVGYHIRQILIALGSGGWFGLGFGQSRQKYQYLPEVSADSIFAVIGEEMGFVGTVIVIILFSLFLYKGFEVAKKAPDMLGRLLAVGITSWISLQFFINVAAMVKLAPLTGMPIPLISYGGSSMLFSLMALGILVGVSRN